MVESQVAAAKVGAAAGSGKTGFKLTNLSLFQLFSMSVGIIGIQFAWSMQIAFSSRVLEPLGADPFLFGLIWCAGPITGIIVQPLVGAWSDRTWTKIGKRRPFIIVGTLISALTLLFFPLASSLIMATLLLWIIDASTNMVQGPYRALVPDNVPPGQQVVANSFINFAFGAGAIISLGVAPLLLLFDIHMTLFQQYLMTSVFFVLAIGYSCLVMTEYPKPPEIEEKKKKESLLQIMKKFLTYDREIHKLCGVQFLTWIGMMSMFIYLTPFVVHNIYGLPDMSTPEFKEIRAVHTQYVKSDLTLEQYVVSEQGATLSRESQDDLKEFDALQTTEREATNTAQIALVAFNIVALILSIPMGYLCNRYSKKLIYTITLGFVVAAFLFAPFIRTPLQVIIMMAFAGVTWSTVLAIPFSFLGDYTPQGEEGTLMGIFNMFIAGPQLISSLAVGWIISRVPMETAHGTSHDWSLAFLIGSGCVFLAMIALQFLKENKSDSVNA